MTQDAVVTKCFKNGYAEVAVTRATACGHNCGSCESCIFQDELKTLAKNTLGASPGQSVVIESRTSKIFGAALLVYILPLLLFFACYALAYALGGSEGMCILVSFIGLALSAGITVLSQRRRARKPISFEIIGFSEGK